MLVSIQDGAVSAISAKITIASGIGSAAIAGASKADEALGFGFHIARDELTLIISVGGLIVAALGLATTIITKAISIYETKRHNERMINLKEREMEQKRIIEQAKLGYNRRSTDKSINDLDEENNKK